MKRSIILCLNGLLAFSLSCTKSQSPTEPKTNPFIGSWKLLTTNGAPPEKGGTFILVFSHDSLYSSDGIRIVPVVSYTFNDQADPKTIDFNDHGDITPGIYKFSELGFVLTLKSSATKPRPTDFNIEQYYVVQELERR